MWETNMTHVAPWRTHPPKDMESRRPYLQVTTSHHSYNSCNQSDVGLRLKTSRLGVLGGLLLVEATSRGRGRVDLGQLVVGLGAVDALLEHGLGLVELKLGLEVPGAVVVVAAVGVAAAVGEVELGIDDLLAGTAPVTANK